MKWDKTPNVFERKRMGKYKFPSRTLPQETKKPCQMHYLAREEYAPGIHLPLAHHGRICHPSEYPSTILSLNTDIISTKNRLE